MPYVTKKRMRMHVTIIWKHFLVNLHYMLRLKCHLIFGVNVGERYVFKAVWEDFETINFECKGSCLTTGTIADFVKY